LKKTKVYTHYVLRESLRVANNRMICVFTFFALIVANSSQNVEPYEKLLCIIINEALLVSCFLLNNLMTHCLLMIEIIKLF